MHTVIVGAGAIGCYLGARLAEHGHAVTLVARGETLAALARDGLQLREPSGETRIYRLPVSERLEAPADLILLAVKTQDLAAACTLVRPAAGDATVVTLQNGVQADHIAARLLGRDHLVGGVAMCAASCLQPGRISVQFPGWLILGSPSGRPSVRARMAARVLGDALPVYLTGHLRAVRWSKLITNLNNGICAATGLSLPEIGRDPAGRALSVRLMREGCAVARAAGAPLDRGLYGLRPRALRWDPSSAIIALLQAGLPAVVTALPERAAVAALGLAGRSRLARIPVRGSTWQSIARGRRSEIAFLNGEIVRLGARLGVPTPWNERVTAAVGAAERGDRCSLEGLCAQGSALVSEGAR